MRTKNNMFARAPHAGVSRRAAWFRPAVLCLFLAWLIGCNMPVGSPPQEGTAGRDLRQDVSVIREIVTTMAANVEATVGQKSGRSSSGQIGLVNIAQQDVTSQMPAAMLAVLGGLLEMKRRRAIRHSWSLTKAIRAAHDELGHHHPSMAVLRKYIEQITRKDRTEGDNERQVERLKPRNGK